jgi:hypothetical protein
MTYFNIKLFIAAAFLTGSAAMAQNNTNESFFSRSQQFDSEGIELYSSNLDLKKHKKVGFGVSLGGANGVLGFNSELNLDPANALVLGLGTGPSYGSFNILWKYNFEGYYLSPYTKLGYSKWFSTSSGGGTARDSDVLRRIFSEKDLKANKFDADFLVSSFGIEYNQLEGELSGTNFYGEVVLLSEVKTSTVIPSGAVGMIYFY